MLSSFKKLRQSKMDDYYTEVIWAKLVWIFKVTFLIIFGLCAWFVFSITVLHSLGVYDVHVSEVPEGPNACIEITEVRYRC